MITLDNKAEKAISWIDRNSVFTKVDYKTPIRIVRCYCSIVYFEGDDDLNRIIEVLNKFLETSEEILIDAGFIDNKLYIKTYCNWDDYGVLSVMLGQINKSLIFIKNDKDFSVSEIRVREDNFLDGEREVWDQGTGSQDNICNSVHWQKCRKLEF